MKKQILIFCHGYNSPFVDVCNQYAAVFDRTRYEVHVAYLVGEYNAEIQQKTQADQVYFLHPAKRAVRGLKLSIIKTLLKLCREKQFEVVVCHRYKPAYIMSLVALFIKIPKIFSVMHELGTLHRRSRQLFVYLLGRKKLIFAGVSNAVREDMLQDARFLKPTEVIVLPNVLNVPQFEQQLIEREQARRELKLANDDFVFGNIGRLVKNKDQSNLIISFAAVAKKFPQAKLIIIGTGQLEMHLKQLVEQQGVAANVIFTGFVAGAFRYVKAFDVYVSSSLQEAFGRVLLEAMVGSVPVIATSVHGVPEVLGNTGILVPAQQPELLAHAMHEMLNMSAESLNALGQRGYERVKNNFSTVQFKEQFLRLL